MAFLLDRVKPGGNYNFGKDEDYKKYEAKLEKQRRAAQLRAQAEVDTRAAQQANADLHNPLKLARDTAADVGTTIVNAPTRVVNDAVALGQLVQPTRASIAERQAQASRTLAPGGGLLDVGGVLGGRELGNEAVFLGSDAGKNIKTTLSTAVDTAGLLAGAKVPSFISERIAQRVAQKVASGETLTPIETKIAEQITDESRLIAEQATATQGGSQVPVAVRQNPDLAALSTNPNPALLERLQKVDRAISLAQKNGGITADQARALVRERQDLISRIQSPAPTPPPTLTPGANVAQETAGEVSQTAKIGNYTAKQSPISSVPEVATTVQKGPNALRRAALSVKGSLNQFGQGGKEITARLSKARDTSEIAQAGFLKQIPTVTKLKRDEFTQFVNGLEALSKGQTTKLSPKVQQAVDEWSQAIPKVREVAQSVGVEVGDLGPYYFPRDYSQALKGKNINRFAEHLVKTGQAENLGEAQASLRYMRSKYDTSFGHFENSRKVDLPDYDKSKNALVNYVNGAFNKIAHAEQFGPNGEIAKQLVDQAGKAGYDVSKVDNLYQIGAGLKTYDQPLVEDFSRSVRAFNRLRSLGTSAILNVGQTANTVAVGGVGRTTKAVGKFLSKTDREFVKDTGVVSDAVLQGIREQTGLAGKVTGKLTAPGFNAVEKFNRSVSAITGRDVGNSLARKSFKGNAKAESVLRDELGVTGDIGPTLTREQQIQAARGMVEKTQFKVDPMDLPAWANSPQGKMVAQFRTFTYKQTKFIYDELLKKAAKGDPLPLMRFMTIGTAIGYLTGNARAVLRSQPFTSVKGNQEGKGTSGTDKFLESLNNVGGFGIGSTGLFIGQNLQSQRLPQYLASAIGGPTAGLTLQTTNNASEALRGSPKNLERQALQNIPIAGPYIANTVFPFVDGWKASKAAGLTEFRKQVGDEKFAKAEEDFNKRYQTWYEGVKSNPQFQKWTLEHQTNYVSDQKLDIQKAVLRDYGFVYEPKKKSDSDKNAEDSLKYRKQ